MKQEYTIIEGLDKFAAAREQFSHLIDRLQSEEIRHWEHGEIIYKTTTPKKEQLEFLTMLGLKKFDRMVV